MARLITFGGQGAAGPPGPAGSAATTPADFTIGTITYSWRGLRTRHTASTLQLTIPVTPPGTIPAGGHIYIEFPDQSSTTAVKMDGTHLMDGSKTTQGQWAPVDMGKFPYDANNQPWVLEFDPTTTVLASTVMRVYVAAYTNQVDNPLVRAGLTGATPSALVTIGPEPTVKPGSGSDATNLLVPSISASVGSVVTVAGKLRRPISVTVTLTGLSTPLPSDWAYQLLGFKDGDITASPVLASGYFNVDGLVGSGPDGIDTAHTFGPEEPTESTNITIFAVAGIIHKATRPNVQGTLANVFVPNTIVPGITASASITIGTTTGVVDPTAQMQALLNSSMAVVNNLFGVAPSGIDNSYLAALAVATANIQSAAVQLANMGASSVGTSQIVNAAITTAKIGSAQITTALIQNAAITTALIANAAVGTAQIANLAVTAAQIANATITSAQIASLDVTKLNAGTISVAVTLSAASITGGSLAITAGGVVTTINSSTPGMTVVSASNFVELSSTGMSMNDGSLFSAAFGTASFYVGAPLAGAGGSPAPYLEVFNTGIRMSVLQSSAGAAGSKRLWYDPADGNRVKYSP